METIKVTGTSKECFKSIMSLIGKYGYYHKVEGYKVEDNNLLFYWYKDTKECACQFPYDLTLEQAAEFAWGWIQNTQPGCEEPNTDGSVEKGWSLVSSDLCYTPKGSHCHENYCFVKITPTWIVYGK